MRQKTTNARFQDLRSTTCWRAWARRRRSTSARTCSAIGGSGSGGGGSDGVVSSCTVAVAAAGPGPDVSFAAAAWGWLGWAHRNGADASRACCCWRHDGSSAHARRATSSGASTSCTWCAIEVEKGASERVRACVRDVNSVKDAYVPIRLEVFKKRNADGRERQNKQMEA